MVTWMEKQNIINKSDENQPKKNSQQKLEQSNSSFLENPHH